MQNPRLAGRYAKSLIELAQEQNTLEAVYTDMLGLQNMCSSSAELVALIKSPIVKGDKKKAIFEQLLNGKVHATTMAFINLLTAKGREANLDEIITSFVSQYKVLNNIVVVKLVTAVALDESTKALLVENISKQLPNAKIDLHTTVNEALIGGFTIETNNKLVDASIAHDLKVVQKQFMQNIYVPNLR
jgi:F-type H+-transporting ATPase subunit delta